MPWVLDPIPDLIPGQGAIAVPGLIPGLTRVPIQDPTLGLILDLIPDPTRAQDANLGVYTMKA